MTTQQQDPERTLGTLQEGQRQLEKRVDDNHRATNQRIDDHHREAMQRMDSLEQGQTEIRQELRATNTRIDHLTLAVIAIGGGIIATGIGIIITLALT